MIVTDDMVHRFCKSLYGRTFTDVSPEASVHFNDIRKAISAAVEPQNHPTLPDPFDTDWEAEEMVVTGKFQPEDHFPPTD